MIVKESLQDFKRGKSPKEALDLGGDIAKLAALKDIASPRIVMPYWLFDEDMEYDDMIGPELADRNSLISKAYEIVDVVAGFHKWAKKIKRTPKLWISTSNDTHEPTFQWPTWNIGIDGAISDTGFFTRQEAKEGYETLQKFNSLQAGKPLKVYEPASGYLTVTLSQAQKLLKDNGIS